MRPKSRLFIRTAALVIITVFCLPQSGRAQDKPLILGIHPFLSSAEIYKRFKPLADLLGRELKRPVQIHLENSYENHLHSVGKGTVDIAFIGPASYVKLIGLYGKVPVLAAYEANGSRTFRGVIVVRKDSAVKTLAQLRGKRFAFGDINSTMSHLVPRFMLLKAGLDAKGFGSYDFLTNHENIALGVLAGNYDAGALKEDIFNGYAEKGLTALSVSEPVPDHLFVARAGLPEEIVRKVSRILLALKDTEEGRRVLGSMQKSLTALVPGRDADYDGLRKLLDSLSKAGVKP